jgi:TonB family C-terminal domain
MQRVIASFALIVLSLLLCHKGFSQGRLLGRVVDGNGAPLPAATIYLSSSSSTQAALSNSDGYYVFLAIPEGEYSLKAFKRGLPKTDPVSVTITANTTTRKDFILGPTGGSVTLLASSKPKEKPAEKPATERPVAALVKPKEEKAAEKPVAEAKPSEAEPTTVAVDEDDEIKRITAEAEALASQLNATVEKDVQIQGGIEAVIKKIVYPETAIHMKIEGKVVARVFVDAKGNVIKIDILKPAHELLNEEAVRVLTEDAVYIPAQANGKPVAGAITVPLNFKIQKVTW